MINIWNIKKINLGIETVLYLKYNHINCYVCKIKKRNSQLEHYSQWSKQEACFAHATRVWVAVDHNSSNTSGKWFDVQSVLHGQVSLAAVNQIWVIHEAMNGCKNLKIH